MRIKKVLPFPAKIKTILDRIYRIYKIIYPGRKPGQILHPLCGVGLTSDASGG
jgi:hypothetical protein